MHKIIFRGEVLDGHERDSVRAKLGQLFRIEDATRLDSLFSGKAVTIKKSLDEANARKYLKALEKAGALVEVEPPFASSLAEDASEPLPDFTDFPEPSAQDLSFNTVMQSFSDEGTLAPEASATKESYEEDSAEEDNEAPSKSWWPMAAGAGAALLVAAAFIFWPSSPSVNKPSSTTSTTAAAPAPLSEDEQAQLESLFAIAAEGSDEEFNQALNNVSDPETRQAMRELREISGLEQIGAD